MSDPRTYQRNGACFSWEAMDRMDDEAEADWLEYVDCEPNACPICGSFSPGHIEEDDEGPCRERRPYY